MDFAESSKYLLSLGNEVSSMKLGLENIKALLATLDDPQNKYLKVQIAGTNGKGSVCAFLDSICTTAGIKTGRFTSPHLVSITERIRIGGIEITENDFARQASKVREAGESLVRESRLGSIPTFFEQITAIALSVFAEERIELAILETGLGGRLDATTAANAEIVAITAIDYDHQEYLGETLGEIAAEKAAIIRPDTKVVAARQRREAEEVIIKRCREVGVEPDFADDVDSNVSLGLLGKHQRQNAAVAVGLVSKLRELNWSISDHDVRSGLETARHPGRLEYLGNVLFDGAHNVAGASALREYLDEFIDQPVTLIFGAMKGKNVREIADILFPAARQVILTKPENSRALETAELLAMTTGVASGQAILTNSVAEALETARKISGADGLICVTGSLYLVGEAKKILNN